MHVSESRREIKIDVWKYIRPILMGLGAVLEKKLDNQDRALRCQSTLSFYVDKSHSLQ